MRCHRRGRYRLDDKYGSEFLMPALLAHLAAGCEQRDVRLRAGTYCGAYRPAVDEAFAAYMNGEHHETDEDDEYV